MARPLRRRSLRPQRRRQRPPPRRPRRAARAPPLRPRRQHEARHGRRDARAPRATRNAPPSSGAMPWTRRDQAGRRSVGLGCASRDPGRDRGLHALPAPRTTAPTSSSASATRRALDVYRRGAGRGEDRKGSPSWAKRPAPHKDDHAMTLRREDVYIANVVKCRPRGDRDPKPDEIATCRGYGQADRRGRARADRVPWPRRSFGAAGP